MSDTVFEHQPGVRASMFDFDNRMSDDDMDRELRNSKGCDVVYGVRTGPDGVARYAGKVVDPGDGTFAIDFLQPAMYQEIPGLAARPNQRVGIPIEGYEYTGILLLATYLIRCMKFERSRANALQQRNEVLDERCTYQAERLAEMGQGHLMEDDDADTLTGIPIEAAMLDPEKYPAIGRSEAKLVSMDLAATSRWADLRSNKGADKKKENIALRHGRKALVDFARLAPYLARDPACRRTFNQRVMMQITWLDNIKGLHNNTITAFAADAREAYVAGTLEPAWIREQNHFTASYAATQSKLRGKKGGVEEL